MVILMWFSGKESACQCRSLIPGSGRSPGEGNGNPFQYSYLVNPMDRGVWWATIHGVTKNQTWLNTHTCTHRIAFHLLYTCELACKVIWICKLSEINFHIEQDSSVQFSHSVVSDSLRPHGLQHTRPPYPSPSPRVCSNSCPLSQCSCSL